jgi:ribosomal protein S18 acetylase RimI-like enzyme
MSVSVRREAATLRPATEPDAQAIYRLQREALGTNYLQFTIYRSEKAVAQIERLIGAENQIFTIAERQEKLAGYANVALGGHEPILNYIAVANAARSFGLGSRLLQAVEAQTRSRGFGTLALDVFESNPRAVEWYAKSGYSTVSKSFLYRIDLTRGVPNHDRSQVDPFLWQMALAAEERDGFSKLSVGTENGEILLGFIAGLACKLLAYRGLTLDRAIEASAAMVDGSRKELIVSSCEPPRPDLSLLSMEKSIRMVKKLWAKP